MLGLSGKIAVISLSISMIIVSLSYAGQIGNFETISPEDAKFSSEKLEAVGQYLEQNGSAAFLGLYDGKVFFSWGEINTKYPVHSIRKAYMNALYGIYIEKGKIDLNKTLKDLAINDIEPVLTDKEKTASVLDLIQSRSGVYHAAAAEAASMIQDRPERDSHAPGSFFYYNNWDFNTLGAIFEQETGKTIFEAFHKDVAVPLGMKHFKGSHEKNVQLQKL